MMTSKLLHTSSTVTFDLFSYETDAKHIQLLFSLQLVIIRDFSLIELSNYLGFVLRSQWVEINPNNDIKKGEKIMENLITSKQSHKRRITSATEGSSDNISHEEVNQRGAKGARLLEGSQEIDSQTIARFEEDDQILEIQAEGQFLELTVMLMVSL